MLQINVHYVLNVHEVHKSLTPMGHFGRDINTGVKITESLRREGRCCYRIRFSEERKIMRRALFGREMVSAENYGRVHENGSSGCGESSDGVFQ